MPSAKTEEGPKKFRTPEECKVCAVPCFYNYYRVRCCEGCKQFFRRAIRNLRDYRCQRRRPGHCNIEKGDRCLGCRLDKCLLVGMNAGQIKQQPANDRRTEDFLQKMAERRHHLLQTRGMNNLELMEADWERAEEEDREPECGGQQEEQVQVEKVGHFKREEEAEEDYSQSSSSSDCLSEPLPLVAVNDVVPLSVVELKLQLDDDFRTLDSLMRTEQKQRRVWEALTDVPPGWLETFDSLEQMVQSPVNILLDLADQFGSSYKSAFKNPKPETDRDRINVTVGFIKVDRTLLVDVAKALPFFQQLELGDKIILLKKAAIPGATLCNSFYSAVLGEQTWTRTSGIQFIKHFKCSPLAGDKKLSQMNQLFLCDSVAIIRQVNPSQEEFVLLLALLYCNSNAADLSSAGRELLYSQSLNYTRMLMSLCQRRLGQMEGAKRLAECFFLLDAMGRMGNVFEMIKSYQEMLYSQRVVRPLFPRSLAAITPRVYS